MLRQRGRSGGGVRSSAAAALLLVSVAAPDARADESKSPPPPSPPTASFPETPSVEEPPPSSLPPEAPPLLNPAAPGWDDGPDSESDGSAAPLAAEPAASAGPEIEIALGVQWLWASGKAIPGVLFRAGYFWFAVDLETSLIFLTEPSPEFDSSVLGSQFGIYALFRPLYGERGELSVGLGSDVYALWNLHGDEWQAALAVRLEGRLYVSKRIGVFGNARAYPLPSSGLELGAYRDHSRGLPVLFGTGVEWRFQ